jgi:hypothetical protein
MALSGGGILDPEAHVILGAETSHLCRLHTDGTEVDVRSSAGPMAY